MSVSDKQGLLDLAGTCQRKWGVEILSTGGTASLLAAEGVPVKEVAEHTGFPEMMAGRVKTLHPKIHGGILARRGVDDAAMASAGIVPIDLVVVNLYPFGKVTANPDCTLEHAIENIDIGGPAMVRAAAKNHAHVVVVVDPDDYPALLAEMDAHGGAISKARAAALAVKAFTHTAGYDAAVADYLRRAVAGDAPAPYPSHFTAQWEKRQDLRYGENPHQTAAFYTEAQPPSGTIASATQIQGKGLSFNNIADADAALECVWAFAGPACVIVKHLNPCGVAVRTGLKEAYLRAFAADPTSAFGGIIAFNRVLDAETAQEIVNLQFAEVIVAPMVAEGAREVLRNKGLIRVLEVGLQEEVLGRVLDFRRVNGGMLLQDKDIPHAEGTPIPLKVVTGRKPTDAEILDLLFAWKVARIVKSNAIVYAKDQATIGVGAGQMSRILSARIAAIKAEEEGLVVEGAVMASDAFFPFRDGLDVAAKEGIIAVIQPGGSVRDEEVIQAANEHGMAMVFTGMRHFRH
jgi:phosphoribosylaminoimidazolecarboxamide formyltransferase/IMP cyclohydrolase